MSKIKTELMAAVAITAKRGESTEDLNKRLITAISEADDATWNAISEPAKDWFNEAATAVNKKKTIPAFPDAEPEVETKEPTTRTRTRAAAAEPELPLDPQVGDAVTAVTKRNKTLVGTIVEIDDEIVVIDVDGKEEELTRDRLASMTVNKGKTATKASDPEPEVALAVGVKVTAVTKRNKTLVGTIVEIDDEIVVIDVDGKEEELTRDRLASLEPVAAPASSARASTRTGTADKPKAEPDKPTPTPRASAKVNGGVSVTTRIRELIASDLDMSKGEVGKTLRTEGLEFRDNTLDLTYAETHKVVMALREAGQLKA